jgi:hypothetical protein
VEFDEVELAVLLVLSEDWLCAANNAFIVSGEICGYLPELTEEVAPLVVLLLPLSIANGLVAPFEDPVFWVDEDDFEFVSDWIASSALDAAPRANNIAKTPTDAACRGQCPGGDVSKRRANEKSSMKSAFAALCTAREHRQFMPIAAEISAHRKLATPALPG